MNIILGNMEVGMKKAFTFKELLKPLSKCRAYTSDILTKERTLDCVQNGKKCAFTMAEVLITLGIIGIVAAMTFPVVIQNSKRQEASARLKKFVSAMEQAIMLSEIDNCSATEWSKQNVIRDENGEVDAAKSNAEVNRYYNLYLKKYLKTITILEEDPESSNRMKVYFADSSSMTLYNGTCVDIIFDYNGDSKPNVSGRDRFKFLLCPGPYNERYHKNKKPFGSYDQKYINSREDALQKCKESASYCANLLEYDNWEFKDDYPYRL